ncbi:MAG TPA: TAXI family TRAP transporter solute-binding subunit [Dongiaceae bacterium]|nr:TAXI family TRAP transporter solute-binding subunit [Dongiaceae bacterium]
MTSKKVRSAVASPLLLSRRRLLAAGVALAATRTFGGGARAAAQDVSYFRIGGGAVGSRLYQLAGTVAAAITNPPGADNCDKNGPCGVPGMVGLAQTTAGSVENLKTLQDTSIESAIVQADVAAAAIGGKDAFKAGGAFGELRGLARLGGTCAQIAVAAASSFQSPADLKGKTVALGPEGGDSAGTARPLLAAFGIGAKRTKLVYGEFQAAYADLATGKVDAVILVDGFPNADLATLAQSADIRLLPVDGPNTEKLRKDHPYLGAQSIPGGTYKGLAGAVPTIEIPLLWVGSAKLDNHLAYALVKALGSTAAQSQNGTLDFTQAALTAPVRLHPGAQTYFEERNAAGGSGSTN